MIKFPKILSDHKYCPPAVSSGDVFVHFEDYGGCFNKKSPRSNFFKFFLISYIDQSDDLNTKI